MDTPLDETHGKSLRDAIDEPTARMHFVGVGGTGMSALAQHRLFAGGRASGSDRSFDKSDALDTRDALVDVGLDVHPQDGSGIQGSALVVASTAIEADIPDLARARELGVPIVHRSELLAALTSGPSVAIAGTSGKSTVTAMIFEVLRADGRDPGLISGGRLRRLMDEGRGLGNAATGRGPVVFEADESDGSLVRHTPATSVLLNLHRDHMEPTEAIKQFRVLRARTRGPFVVSEDDALAELRPGSLVFGTGAQAKIRASRIELQPDRSAFAVAGTRVDVPMPGEHNVRNALAAFATCRALGVEPEVIAAAIADYRGVHRRMELSGETRGVRVYDDFAHNPDKIRATLLALRGMGRRVLAFFQPHGYASTRFQRDDLIDVFQKTLRKRDRLWIADIYFAGGTVSPDIKSADIVDKLTSRDARVELVTDREAFKAALAAEAKEGDVAVVMGARDPSLPRLAREIVESL